jgi:hypothetical protein
MIVLSLDFFFDNASTRVLRPEMDRFKEVRLKVAPPVLPFALVRFL